MRKPAALLRTRSRAVRRLSAAAVTVSAAAGLFIGLGAVPASADTSTDPTITVTYPVTGSTYIKSLRTTESLGTGSLSSVVDLTTFAIDSADLSLPASTVSFKELGFIPVSATTELVTSGTSTGTADLTTGAVSVTSGSVLKITSLKVAGIKIPLGSSCQSGLITTTVSSQAGFNLLAGGTLSGTYSIPKFSGCGLIANALINLTIPGSGNTLTLTLGAASLS